MPLYIYCGLLIVSLATSLVTLVCLARLLLCVRRTPVRRDNFLFFHSERHAQELRAYSQRDPEKPCALHVAALDSGIQRPYTACFDTAGRGLAVYRAHYPDAVSLGRGRDLGPIGWWR